MPFGIKFGGAAVDMGSVFELMLGGGADTGETLGSVNHNGDSFKNMEVYISK